MALSITGYSGVLLQNGNKIPGVAVRLYNSSGKVAATTTNKLGEYSFSDLAANNYQIRFFGEGFTDDDYINFVITGTGGELDPITFAGTPLLTVAETGYDYEQQGEISVAQITLNNLEVLTGKIVNILVEFKLSADSKWEILNKFEFGDGLPGVSGDLSSVVYTSDIPLKEKPSVYDFRVTYFNGDGIPAKNESGILTTTETAISFNGIPDMAEYVGVATVDVQNSNSAGDKIPTNILMIKWEHPLETGAGTYEDAAGNPIEVNEDQVKNVSSFVIYMFVSANGNAPSEGKYYPVKTETEGTWYLLDTLAPNLNFASIRLPQKKQVMVWVGFTTPGVVSAATSEVLKF